MPKICPFGTLTRLLESALGAVWRVLTVLRWLCLLQARLPHFSIFLTILLCICGQPWLSVLSGPLCSEDGAGAHFLGSQQTEPTSFGFSFFHMSSCQTPFISQTLFLIVQQGLFFQLSPSLPSAESFWNLQFAVSYSHVVYESSHCSAKRLIQDIGFAPSRSPTSKVCELGGHRRLPCR